MVSKANSRPSEAKLKAIMAVYASKKNEIDLFRKQVVDFFQSPLFSSGAPLALVHSVKSRMKDESHLEEKIKRKSRDTIITPENFLGSVTDLAGVRVLHLYTEQFAQIHKLIQKQFDEEVWVPAEKPVAYSWDPETTLYFRGLGLKAVTRETYYSSVHYLVKPRRKSNICCEIQVRTLFEEVWGEIDHAINYPTSTEVLACKEQLRVLAKLASTGTRLADSIFRISQDGETARR